ncbi:MAG: Flagellar motor switch protein FliN [Rhodoglobus sp.]|jgi:flagellar motor switch protein FliN/FliY|nr:Flagellar motor switch protein FliN [Rhodoglobus sp.]
MTTTTATTPASATRDYAMQVAAVEALADALPGAERPTVVNHPSPEQLSGPFSVALAAEFVGVRSADIALVLNDRTILAEAAGVDEALAEPAELVRPAIEAASATLGVGVLGDVTEADASALVAATGTAVFELTTAAGSIGWFAIRLHATAISPAPAAVVSSPGNLSRISNVEMALTVEIGRTRMAVRDLLALEPGAVVELDRSAGTPADILLNGKLIAHGDVVVVDQDYAVRITRILDNPEAVL